MFRFIAENKAKGVNLGKLTKKSNKKLNAQTEKIIRIQKCQHFCKKEKRAKEDKRLLSQNHAYLIH